MQTNGNGTTDYLYQVCRQAFASPDYVTTDHLFGFCNFSHGTSGPEASGGCDITIDAFKIYVDGSWVSSTDVPKSVPAGAGVLLGGFAAVSMPANAVVHWICKFHYSAGNSKIPVMISNSYWNPGGASDAARGFTSAGGYTSEIPNDGPGPVPTWTNGVGGRSWGPSMCFARGGDGRPAVVVPGDSIGFGAAGDTLPGCWTVRREFGMIGVGLDSSVGAKRLAYLNLCVPGQNPIEGTSGWKNRPRWEKKLDLVKQVTLLQGQPPFDIILSQHGENSCSAAKSLVTGMPAYYATLQAEWPGLPIYQHELLARPRSTNLYRDFAGQTVTANSSGVPDANIAAADAWTAGNPATMGDRWLFWTALQPGGALRSAGWIQGSIPTWAKGSYDTGDNRDKLAVRPFTTTTTTAYVAPQIGLANAASPGMHLCATSAGSGYLGVSRVLGAGNLTAEVVPNGFSSPAIGSDVWEVPHDTAGLHPSGLMHRDVYSAAFVDWKAAQGWV